MIFITFGAIWLGQVYIKLSAKLAQKLKNMQEQHLRRVLLGINLVSNISTKSKA